VCHHYYWKNTTAVKQRLNDGVTQMSKTFIGGAVCQEFESEAPAAEEMVD